MIKIFITTVFSFLLLYPISLFAGDFQLDNSVVTESDKAAKESEPSVEKNADKHANTFNNSFLARTYAGVVEEMQNPSPPPPNVGGHASLSCSSEKFLGSSVDVLQKDCSGQHQHECGYNFKKEIEQKYGSASEACELLGDADHNDAGGEVRY
jgi:hypothetical protein